MFRYKLCGWCIHSDFELPELSPWLGKEQPVEVTIRLGTITLENIPALSSHAHSVQEQGDLFQVADVARYWITGGKDILIEPCMTADPSAIRLFLLGTAFGLLCHQRGLVPLHASCVMIDGGAVAFAGPSGIGKSTLAAALARHGYPVVSDDVCVIDSFSSGLPRVLPFAPRLKLIRDSLSAMGFSLDQAEAMGYESEKLDVISRVSVQSAPLPLSAVYHLGVDAQATGQCIKQLHGAAALALLNRNIYRINAAHRMGKQRILFESTARIARQVPNYSLTRSFSFSGLEEFIRCLLSQRAA